MKRARNADKLTIQGHQIQIFADLSPYTVQKRRSLKPLLQVLTQKEITYRWSFPFRLNFYHHNKPFAFSSFPEGERLLLHPWDWSHKTTHSCPPWKHPLPWKGPLRRVRSHRSGNNNQRNWGKHTPPEEGMQDLDKDVRLITLKNWTLEISMFFSCYW